MLTFLPLSEIDEMDKWEGSKLNEAKEILAFELTKLVHGENEATKAQEASRAVFSGAGSHADMPTVTLDAGDLTDNAIGILSLMVKGGLCGSNGEARRLVQQGGVSVNEEKVTDPAMSISGDMLKEGVIVKKGKKSITKFLI